MRMRGQRAARPLRYGTDPVQSGKVDNYDGQILNYGIPVPDGTYYPLPNLIDPAVQCTGRGFSNQQLGPNWPRVKALYGTSLRTGASPINKAGGVARAGVPNTNRLTSTALSAYLMGEGIARRSIITPSGTSNG